MPTPLESCYLLQFVSAWCPSGQPAISITEMSHWSWWYAGSLAAEQGPGPISQGCLEGHGKGSGGTAAGGASDPV